MPRKTFKLPRGICAHCHREAALMSDGRVHSRHVCPGAGRMPEALVERKVISAMNSWDGPWHEKIRVLHETSSVDMAISRLIQLADELHVHAEKQQQEISRLHNAMDDLRRVNDSHYQRLNKEIDRLRGVHGA